ncbi:MAG: ABC transporter permease, partial [Candidatus Methanoperedens sp.]|nr:ABC transporter permease [Candidatus Methanoperedens sp.]
AYLVATYVEAELKDKELNYSFDKIKELLDNVYTYLGKKGKVPVIGVDQGIWSQITTTKIKTGRMLDSADQNVIVIGGRLAASYFDQPVGINKMVMMNSSAFRVVGILDDQSKIASIYLSRWHTGDPGKDY